MRRKIRLPVFRSDTAGSGDFQADIRRGRVWIYGRWDGRGSSPGRGGADDGDHDLDERGLARAVRPQKSEDFAAAHLHGHALQSMNAPAVDFGHVPQVDRVSVGNGCLVSNGCDDLTMRTAGSKGGHAHSEILATETQDNRTAIELLRRYCSGIEQFRRPSMPYLIHSPRGSIWRAIATRVVVATKR